MKKILGAIVLLLLVVAGGLYYLYSNMDRLAKQQIEISGTEAMGTAVTVDEVVIDLPTGSASIRGLRVANPEGYSAGSMLGFAELNLVLDITNLSRHRIGIQSIVARNPHVLYEMQGNVSNLDVIHSRLAGGNPSAETSVNSADDILLDITRINIQEIGATLSSPLLSAPVEVSLGDIILLDLSGTPDQIAQQIMGPVMAQLSNNAARALLSKRAGNLRDDVLEQVDASLEAAGETLRETGANIREGLGNLFDRDDAEETGTPVAQP